MTKLLFKVALVAGLMLLVPYYLLGGVSLPGFLQDLLNTGKGKAPVAMKGMSTVTTDENVTLYKCTNENGQVEFSQSPCTGEGETIHLKPNVNVVQRTRLPEEEEQESGGPTLINLGNSDSEDGSKDKKEDGAEIGNPYDPDNIQKLIKDAKNVGKLMEQHGKEVDNATRTQ
jgi:hypothetical protein